MLSASPAKPVFKYAFSLVELSIVLVILGLLTGGILTGQNLIRAAELRAITTEVSAFQGAVETFKDKFRALPGDMNNATIYWGASNSNTVTCPTTESTDTKTCNGNGDFIITFSEGFQTWKQLSNEGLIAGNFFITNSSGTTANCELGRNCPSSKMPDAMYGVRSVGVRNNTSGYYSGTYDNVLYFGAFHSTLGVPVSPLLQAKDAWNIDTKTDDGKPGTGQLRTFYASTRPYCATTDNKDTAEYDLQKEDVACNLLWPYFFGRANR